MSRLTVATLNVRGLRSALRRVAFFASLRAVAFDCLFVQEAHVGGQDDVSSLKEAWDGGPSVWGGGNVRADGVGIVFRGWDFRIEAEWEVVAGRILCVDAQWRGVSLRLVNVYAPSVPAERQGFMALVEPLLFTNRTVVLGGDFNVDLARAPGCDLAGVVSRFLLGDAASFGGRWPPVATWANSRAMASRLDYLFFPGGVRVISYSVTPAWLSDHCVVAAVVDVGAARRAPGPWRLRASLLEDEAFVQALKAVYWGWKGLRPLFSSWADWWEGVKARVGIFTRRWCRDRARERRARAAEWTAELRHLWRAGVSAGAGGQDRMAVLRGLLKDLFVGEARALLTSAGVRDCVAGEVPSGSLFSSARRRQQQSGPDELAGPAGPVSDLGGVLDLARDFYSDLFQARQVDPVQASSFLACLEARLSLGERATLEAELSLEEVHAAMMSLQVGKTPEGDGLPIEFYRALWP